MAKRPASARTSPLRGARGVWFRIGYGTLRLGSCTVDLDRGRVVCSDPVGEVSLLGSREALLLAFLAARPGQNLDRDTLARGAGLPSPRSVDAAVARLRRKIERDPARPVHLITARGSGYRFEPLDDAPVAAATSLGALTGRLLRLGPVTVHLDRRAVERPDGTVELTAKEVALLEYLASRPGRGIERDELLRRVWGYRATGTTRTLDTTMATLRRKVEIDPGDPRYLRTVHGLGYRFDPDREAPIEGSGELALVAVRVDESAEGWLEAPERMAEARIEHDALLRRHLPAHGGSEVFTGADHLLVSFPEVPAAWAWIAAVRAAIGGFAPRLHTSLVVDRCAPVRALDPETGRRVLLGREVARLLDLSAGARGRLLATAAAAAGVGTPLRELGEHAALGEPVRLYGPLDDPPLPGLRRSIVAARSEPFVGRERLLERLAPLSPGAVVLWGPPGVGKSRLAEALAARAACDAWRCDLSVTDSIPAVCAAIAQQLGALPPGGDGVGFVGRLLQRQGPCLLVLDGCDGLAERLGSVLAAWCAAAPEATLLATSRVAFDPDVAVLVRVEPLDPAAGRALLRARAPVPLPAVPALDALADALDGLPLAIELVAAWLDVLDPAEALASLDDLLDAPRGGGPRGGLSAALALSIGRLPPEARAALARLAVADGGVDLPAAVALIDAPRRRVLDWIDLLHRHSLLRSVPGGAAGERRFEVLSTVRSLLAAADPDARSEGLARHARHFASLLGLVPGFGLPWLASHRSRLTVELPNLLQAASHGEAGPALDAALAALAVLPRVGRSEEALALARRTADPLEARGRLLARELYVAMHLGRHAEAVDAARRAEVLIPSLEGQPSLQIELCLWISWFVAALQGDLEPALGWCDRALAQARAHCPDRLGAVQLQRSDLLARLDRSGDALAAVEEGLARLHPGDLDRAGALRALSARLHVFEGRFAAARAALAPLEARLDDLSPNARSSVLEASAASMMCTFEHPTAIALLEARIPELERSGAWIFAADRLCELCELRLDRGDLEEAEAAARAVGPLLVGLPAPKRYYDLALLARVRALLGDHAGAWSLQVEAESMLPDTPLRFEARARLHLWAGRPEDCLAEVRDHLERGDPHPWFAASAHRIAGLAWLALGRGDAARSHLSLARDSHAWPVGRLIARCALAVLDAADGAARREPELEVEVRRCLSRMGAGPRAELAAWLERASSSR